MISAAEMIPRNKHDFERLNVLIAAGPKAAEPYLEELLIWVQDMNWPIAEPMAEFLITVGEPLIPHLKKILLSNDDTWIAWVLEGVIAKLPPEFIRNFDSQLYGLATSWENNIVPIRIAASAGLWDKKTLTWLVDNHIRAYEQFVLELREMRQKLEQQE